MLLLKQKFLILLVFLAINAHSQNNQDLIIKSIPENLPASFSMALSHSGEKLTLQLEKNTVFGKNTRFLIDDGKGNLIEIDKGPERTYLGYVLEYPDSSVSAILTDEGLTATIDRPGYETLEIRPSRNDKNKHEIFTALTNNAHSNFCNVHFDSETAHPIKAPTVKSAQNESFKTTSKASVFTGKKLLTNDNDFASSTATLPSAMANEVFGFEIGVEIGSRAFFADTSYDGKLASAQASAQSVATNLDKRYLSGSGIKHTLGTVIIRTNANTDPLRDKVTSTGGATNARSSLDAFRDYWNNNPDKVGRTHDLAVYHVLSAPSGLAYVNAVNTKNKYGTMGGRGATSWANGTAVHEVGHLWSLGHTNNSGLFYEVRPRKNAGSDAPGGNNFFISVMHGSGNHNIGRLATNEAKRVLNARNNKKSAGTLVRNPGPIAPFGVFDRQTIASPTSSGTFDVIANDYDFNNDVLDVRLLDKVSNKGGTISLSQGTGPGGRNEIKYTPPASGLDGEDFFHYTVFDTSGRRDFGAVYVVPIPNTKVDIDLNVNTYRYDLGTPTSPVPDGWTRISELTNGDINWSAGKVDSRDRGVIRNVNRLNRDFVFGSKTSVLSHKIRNGFWKVTINLGDANGPHDNMTVKIEGKTVAKSVNSDTEEFIYVIGDRIEVRDGKLDIEISDEGGNDPNWVWTRLSMTFEGVLSTTDLGKEDKNIVLYPNPVNSILNLSFPENRLGNNTSISIYDGLGKLLKTAKINNQKEAIDVSRFSSGIYFLKVTSNNQVIKNATFVKQ